MSKTALIVVDVQKDFCEGGSLAVKGGTKTAEAIAEHIRTDGDTYDTIVFTRDWHTPGSDNGGHFSEEPDFVDTWPAHCVADTPGAQYNEAVSEFPVQYVEFRKGQEKPAYSGFEGTNVKGENLHDYLSGLDIAEVYVCGIAADYCVRATAQDAVHGGYQTSVMPNLTVGIARDGESVAEEIRGLQ